MSDKVHKQVDKMIEDVEEELYQVYKGSLKTLKKELDKIQDELSKTSDNEEKARLIARSKRIVNQIKKMAYEIQNINKSSIDIIMDNLYTCYTINHEYATYNVEHDSGYDTGYNLFNRDSIKKIVKKELTPFTEMAYDGLKDQSTIIRDLTREIMQSVLLGESNQKLAKRVAAVTDKNMKQSILIARTEMTRVQNAGRQDAFNRGESMGLKLEKKWISTIDARTRESHARLNGETVGLNDKFSNGLEYPGGMGAAKEVCNCRCTMVTEFVGLQKSAAELKLDEELKRMSFEQWKELRS